MRIPPERRSSWLADNLLQVGIARGNRFRITPYRFRSFRFRFGCSRLFLIDAEIPDQQAASKEIARVGRICR